MFRKPQITIHTPEPEQLAAFYERLGFTGTFRSPAEGRADHIEMRLDGFTLGLASTEAARRDHAITLLRGGNRTELVLWCDDAQTALDHALRCGATLMSPAHEFRAGRLVAGWIADPEGNAIQIVSERMRL